VLHDRQPTAKESRETRVAPSVMNPALPLSPGVIANGFLYVSGFGPHDPVTG
jgi:enamine deaminase RidA (YjgF/YER057c/UK114 family)